MSIVKDLSVSEGDMFYIKHGSDNFSIIDCNIIDERRDEIISEIKSESKDKGILRFISTHPDEDHIYGLDVLDDEINILNFYCVDNEATKEELTDAFKRYTKLRNSEKSYKIFKNCSRKWMNQDDETRKSSGINIKWPDNSNKYFKEALDIAKKGGSPNNICPIVSYSIGKISYLWMGDLETEYLRNIKENLNVSNITVLFAPHHGRKSGRIPSELLEKIDPKIVIIGEAPSEDIEYYASYNKITQNSAGDIAFKNEDEHIDIYVSNYSYEVEFLKNYSRYDRSLGHYIGTLDI